MFTKTLSFSISFIIINIFVHSISSAQGTRTEYEIRLLKESDRNSYIVLSAPADLSGVVDFKFPVVKGIKGQVLAIDSVGKMGWVTPSPAVPAGTIMQYAGTTAPDGWLMCDGSSVDQNIYAALFAAISTNYGAGDGVNTFKLPDLRAKFPLGKDATKELGATGGADSVILSSLQMPTHRHTMIMSSQGTQAGIYNAQVLLSNPPEYLIYLNVAPNGMSSLFKQAPVSEGAKKPLGIETISNEGGGQPHNNMPPYVVVNYIIKY